VKKILAIAVCMLFLGGLVLISSSGISFAKDKDKDIKAKDIKAEVKKDEPKVICKFKTKEKMTEFEQLYVAKQATFGRMGVLQAYFSMEQNNLKEIDKQLEEKLGLKMDPTKMYDLDRDAMEIRELGPIPETPQVTSAEKQ